MWEDVEPDILVTAKGLGAVMPTRAFVARESIMTWSVGSHGSIFGGNPVCCAAALVTLAVVEELLPHVRAMGERLLDHAHGALLVRRGRGLIVGRGVRRGPRDEGARPAPGRARDAAGVPRGAARCAWRRRGCSTRTTTTRGQRSSGAASRPRRPRPAAAELVRWPRVRMSGAGQLDLVPLLDRAAAVLAAVRDEAMLVAAMDEVMARVVDCEYVGLFFLDRASGRLRHAFARGFTEAERRAAEATAMDRHVGEVFRSRTLLHLAEVTLEEDRSARVNPRRHTVRSRLTVPVVGRGETVGVISLGCSRPSAFSPEQISLVSFVATLVGVVYWNLEDLRALAAQHALTRAQKDELLLLSGPILEAAPGVLLIPLVGRVDHERAAQLASRLLRTIEARPTRAVVFDVTGMEAAEEASIGSLLGIIRAAGLMGARCLLSGVTPRIARQMAALDLRLPGLRICATVGEALATATDRDEAGA